MKPLAAAQSTLSIRNPLPVVTLCKLTTYSNRLTGSVAATRYFSEGTRTFNWQGGAPQTFEPWLVSIDAMRSTMSHLPDPSPGGENALRHTRRLVLRNAVLDDGTRLWNALRAENILFARVEISELILDRAIGQGWHDLRSITGTDPTFFARGEVTRVLRVTEQEIELEVRSELPVMPWLVADQAAINDPRDLGKRLPIGIGAVKRLEAIAWDVGAVTTLAKATVSSTVATQVNLGATTIVLADASSFPTSGTILINGDSITYTGKSTNTLTGVSGVSAQHAVGRLVLLNSATVLELTDASLFPTSGTVLLGAGEVATYTGKTGNQLTGVAGLAKPHGIGDTVIEKIATDAIFILSGVPLSAVSALYAWAPWSEQAVRITSGYTITLADTAPIAAKSVTTARFSPTQLQALTDLLLQNVARQPARSTDTIAPPSLMPTIEIDAANTVTLVAGSVGIRPVGDTAYPVNVGTSFPQVGDNARIRYVFTDLSQPTADPPVEIVQQEIHFLASFMNPGGTHTIEVKLLDDSNNELESVVVNILTGLSSHAPYVVTFTDPTHVADADRVELEIQTAGGTGTQGINLSSVRRERVYRSRPGITTQPQVAETGGTEVQVRSASVGAGIRIFADCTGPVVPLGWLPLHEFETVPDGVANATVSIDGGTLQSGGGSLKIVPSEGSLIHSEALDDPAADSDVTVVDCTKATETTIKTEGSGSLKITGNASNDYYAEIDLDGAHDFLTGVLQVDVRAASGHVLTNSTTTPSGADFKGTVWIALIDSGGHGGIYCFGPNNGFGVLDEWVTLQLRGGSARDHSFGTGGFVDWQNIVTVRVGFNNGDSTAGRIEYVDNLRIRSGHTVVAQLNSASSLGDWASSGDYRVRVYSDREELVGTGSTSHNGLRIDVKFTDEVETGTTAPSAYKLLANLQSGGATKEDTWSTIQKTASNVGSPTVAAVRTLRIEIDTQGESGLTYFFDLLEAAAESYSVASGQPLQKGPDVLRYILTEICGQPHSAIDATSFSAAATNLGTDAFGCDLRQAGDDFESIMLRLSAEMRGNMISDERSSGAVYRLLTATSSYGFGASVRTIDDWVELLEETRTGDDVQTRFVALYDFDPALGDAGQVDAYRKAISYVDATAEAKFGRREGGHLPFVAISADATAAEVAGYYAAERARVASLWSIRGVPWRLGYDLERGDIVAFTPPWAFSAAKGRILETVKDPDSGLVDLRLAEVA